MDSFQKLIRWAQIDQPGWEKAREDSRRARWTPELEMQGRLEWGSAFCSHLWWSISQEGEGPGEVSGHWLQGEEKTLKISAMFYSQSAPFCNEGSWLLPLSQHFLLSKRKKYNREVFSICSKTNVDRKRNKGESGQVLSYSHCRILAFLSFENGFTILFRRGMMNHWK